MNASRVAMVGILACMILSLVFLVLKVDFGTATYFVAMACFLLLIRKELLQ